MRRRRRRARKRYLWSGIKASETIPDAATALVFEIVGPSTVSTVADMLLERVVFDLSFTRGGDDTNPIFIGAYLMVVPTDIDEVPTTDLVYPLSSDIDALEKRPMWWRMFRMMPPPIASGEEDPEVAFGGMGTGEPAWYQWLQTNQGTAQPGFNVSLGGCLNGGQPFDINVKRKLGGDQSLVLVVGNSANENNEVAVDVLARALISVGRK